MIRTNPRCLQLCAALLVLGVSSSAMAEARTLCVFDPSGANGDAFQLMKVYRTAAAGWGVEFTLKPYTDETLQALGLTVDDVTAAISSQSLDLPAGSIETDRREIRIRIGSARVPDTA